MKNQGNTTFGSRLRQIRKKAKLSQKDLAEKLGFSTSGSISNIEIDKTPCDSSTLREIAEIFDVDLNWLINGKDMQKAKSADGSAQAFEILRPYVEAHIGEIAREITNIEDEIIELKRFPDRNITIDIPGRIRLLENLLWDNLKYFEKVLNDIDKSKNKGQ